MSNRQIMPIGILRNKHLFLLLIIILIGSVLRLYHLGKQNLWLDEAYSVMMSRNLIGLWFEQIKDSSPPLYYTILHYWIDLFGKNEFSLRFLSSIFGILLIPLLYIAGASVFNKRVGIYAALFAAISPIHIYYSQEVRMYTLLAFLSLVSFFMLFLSLEKNKNTHWIIYALATIFCLYVHNYGVLLLSAEFCFYIFFSPNKKCSLPRFILSQICIFIAYLPRMIILSRQITMDINPWISAPSLKDMGLTFLHFSLLSWKLPLTGPIFAAFKIAIPVFVIIFLFGVFARLRQKAFLLTYFIIPLGLAFAVSFKKPIYVAGRYDMLVFPAFCLIIGVGLSKIKGYLLQRFLLIIIILATAFSLFNYYFIYRKSNDRFISEYVQKNSDKEDIIVATELSIVPFEYYWKQDYRPKLFQFPSGPKSAIVKEALTGEEEYINYETRKLIEKIYPLVNQGNELWVLYQPFFFSDKLVEVLGKNFKNTNTINFLQGDNLNQISKIYIFKKLTSQK